ncbi:hypothetical protein K3172_15115 [Qipengyuania sp. 6B39]|uniref:hypothetical protein n=1 Tax=Qipengyuania proteolytica TaxID=2867239 RepID=UPI001C8AD1AC|nr:hypothetical protein [Qipengyuania proteolytica]MBX7497188.1 hypothetical protein [Qipengyuania proteolytica]
MRRSTIGLGFADPEHRTSNFSFANGAAPRTFRWLGSSIGSEYPVTHTERRATINSAREVEDAGNFLSALQNE